jgi:phosphopentomutase
MRALVVVLDSVGGGFAPDAGLYGDDGADTVGHIAAYCAAGKADDRVRAGPLNLPTPVSLGFGEACRLAGGAVPPDIETRSSSIRRYACAREISRGKDTPSGHWEIAGVPVSFDWPYFPKSNPCFPPQLIQEFSRRADLPGILGNRHASGPQIIDEFGIEHVRTGKPICYTSADSVFQFAAHEQAFGLERLYSICEVAHALVAPLKIGRVIAPRSLVHRLLPSGARRTGATIACRHLVPALLYRATSEGRDIVTVGKITDKFANSGTGRVLKADGNDALFNRTLEALDTLRDGRRDAAGYACAL